MEWNAYKQEGEKILGDIFRKLVQIDVSFQEAKAGSIDTEPALKELRELQGFANQTYDRLVPRAQTAEVGQPVKHP